MTQAPAAVFKIPTESPQPAPGKAAEPPGRAKNAPRAGRSPVLASGNGRAATRGDSEVVEMECGITVYPVRSEQDPWRAVWYEDGQRQQCEAATEDKLAAKLERVKVRLEADAPKMRQPGAALIAHCLAPDRLAVSDRWSREHAHSQGRLCAPYAAPVIGEVAGQDIKAGHMQQIVKRACLAAGWRDTTGNGRWTWHGLRHVFCTTALFTWKLDATDVSRMAGHANYRITLDIYVGPAAGVLDRARDATA